MNLVVSKLILPKKNYEIIIVEMNKYPLPEISGDDANTKYLPKLKELIKVGKAMNQNQKVLEGFSNQQYANIEGFVDLSTINANLTNQNDNNNVKASTYNAEREIVLRKEELNQLENEEINQQLIKMQNLQSEVFTKERLIEQNLYQSDRNENNMRTLMGGLLFAIVMFLLISMYGSGSIDDSKLSKFFIILLVIFSIFLMYQYNILYMNDSLRYIFSFAFLSNVGEKIEEKTAQMKEDIQKARYGQDYDTWKNENCGSCPPTPGPETVSGMDYTTEISGYIPSFYYQDGSTPNQVIYPTNTRDTSGPYQDQIRHVDINSMNERGLPDPLLVGPNDGQLVATNTYTRSL